MALSRTAPTHVNRCSNAAPGLTLLIACVICWLWQAWFWTHLNDAGRIVQEYMVESDVLTGIAVIMLDGTKIMGSMGF